MELFDVMNQRIGFKQCQAAYQLEWSLMRLGDRLAAMGHPMDGECPLWVVCNADVNLPYGAVHIFDPVLQEKAVKLVGNSFYILPSSVHEVLLLPTGAVSLEPHELRDYVIAINTMMVSDLDRLSDHVYEYRNGTIKEVA